MLRVADKRSILPTLPPRLAALVGPKTKLLLAGGVLVLGGLAGCYVVWRRRCRSSTGRFGSPIAGNVDDASILRHQETSDYEGEIDEALDESFPASDPPSFNARGTGKIQHNHRHTTAPTKP